MIPTRARPLRDVLAMHRDEWDRDGTRPSVREAFGKVVDCGTEALGAEVFASDSEERVVFHTCKSRACPSCGYQATRAWQRDQWRELPDVPYAHVCLTMPDVLWPLFRRNRHLLHDLPVLGAQVLRQWAQQRYGIRLMIVVIPHTFGRHLNFNCHLHILVSEGGLTEDGASWRPRAPLDRKALMPMWRYAVITLLREAARVGVLDTDLSRRAVLQLLTAQYERWWNIDITRFRSKKQFLGYAGRYARRPPIAQHRFRVINRQEIRFVTKDTRTKQTVETTYTPAAFLAALADHIPDRYRHAIRYFGLLAPRVKSQTHETVFALLGQKRLGKPRRLRWATSLQKSFGIDPLLDRTGQRMRWARRVSPEPAGANVPNGAGARRELTLRLRRSRTDVLPARENGLWTAGFQRFDAPRHEARPDHCAYASRPSKNRPRRQERAGTAAPPHRALADYARFVLERTRNEFLNFL